MRHVSTRFESLRPPRRAGGDDRHPAACGATALADAAREVIAARGCTMLLIERIVRDGRVSIRVDAIGADGGRARGIARSGDPAMRTLCQAADSVLRRLAATRPGGADDRIGLMTDGVGVLFSPRWRSVMADHWLGTMLLGPAETVALAPFAPAGGWARLTAGQRGMAH